MEAIAFIRRVDIRVIVKRSECKSTGFNQNPSNESVLALRFG